MVSRTEPSPKNTGPSSRRPIPRNGFMARSSAGPTPVLRPAPRDRGVVGIVPNTKAITRLVGALRLEQNDEGAVARRSMTLETLRPSGDTEFVSLPAMVG